MEESKQVVKLEPIEQPEAAMARHLTSPHAGTIVDAYAPPVASRRHCDRRLLSADRQEKENSTAKAPLVDKETYMCPSERPRNPRQSYTFLQIKDVTPLPRAEEPGPIGRAGFDGKASQDPSSYLTLYPPTISNAPAA
jgi:hypothetical protein